MGILDVFKKKKKEPDQPPEGPPVPEMPAPSEVPLSPVMSMQQQGLTNNQIIQALQRQGYAPNAIYDALAQAEAKRNIEPLEAPPEQFTPPMQPAHPASALQPPQAGHPDMEALVEQIVEEKWETMQKEHGKLNEWKDSLNSRMDKLEQSLSDLRTDLDGLHKAIVARVGEYDKTLMDVGTEIKAMEKVFQKVLPELTDNIQELSRITKSAKPSSTKKKIAK